MRWRPIPVKPTSCWQKVFDLCAGSLHWAAQRLDQFWPGGMDYIKINVILFCIILPMVLAASLGLNLTFLMDLL